jgi:hypothetical protein
LRADLGWPRSPCLPVARSQHEQGRERRNGDQRNGREEQHGSREQKRRGQREKNCSQGQGDRESKNDISFPHALSAKQLSGLVAQAETSERIWDTRPYSLATYHSIGSPFAQVEAPCQSIRASATRRCAVGWTTRSSGGGRSCSRPNHAVAAVARGLHRQAAMIAHRLDRACRRCDPAVRPRRERRARAMNQLDEGPGDVHARSTIGKP